MQNTPSEISSLLTSLRTTDEANELVETIDAVLSMLFSVQGKSIPDLFDEKFDQEKATLIKQYLKELQIDLTNQEEIKRSLRAIQEAIRSARILFLTVAIPLTAQAAQRVGNSGKRALGKDVLLEISINPEIIAGAIIVFEGKYLDYSVKKKLDILFEAKRDEIMKFLR